MDTNRATNEPRRKIELLDLLPLEPRVAPACVGPGENPNMLANASAQALSKIPIVVCPI